MSPRLVLMCLSLLVVLAYAPLPTAAAPHEGHIILAEGNVDVEVVTPPTPEGDTVKSKERTFFLLLPLLFPDQFYFS